MRDLEAEAVRARGGGGTLRRRGDRRRSRLSPSHRRVSPWAILGGLASEEAPLPRRRSSFPGLACLGQGRISLGECHRNNSAEPAAGFTSVASAVGSGDIPARHRVDGTMSRGGELGRCPRKTPESSRPLSVRRGGKLVAPSPGGCASVRGTRLCRRVPRDLFERAMTKSGCRCRRP